MLTVPMSYYQFYRFGQSNAVRTALNRTRQPLCNDCPAREEEMSLVCKLETEQEGARGAAACAN
jgi:hypothetical protein